MDIPDPQTIEQIDVTAVNRRSSRSLYKSRVKIHPRLVHGLFRRVKWIVMAISLTIYYVTPWLRWDRGSGAPDQAVLIDIPSRRFYFFFIELWPQDFFLVTGLLIMAGIGLFLMTSVAGRVWCGYACPQTVWTDLFIHVERLIEGDRNDRLRLDKAPLGWSKALKRVTKHASWLVIALMTGGAWIFYFADAPTLARQLVSLTAPDIAYITMAGLTFTTYALGGLMREQVCTYMCPWPRILGAMMDEESLVVTYRAARGEPRGFAKSGDTAKFGDCVDCKACVAACPMGIDIRDGQQLECITCALCIDACDDVMSHLKRPQGLIAYASLAGEARAARGEKRLIRTVRPRTLAYFGLWALVGVIMLYALLTRPEIELNVLHDRNPLFVRMADGDIRNAYTIKILNKSHTSRSFHLAVKGLDGAGIGLVGVATGMGDVNPVMTVDPDELRAFRLLVTAPGRALSKEEIPIQFVLADINGAIDFATDTIFRGPKK